MSHTSTDPSQQQSSRALWIPVSADGQSDRIEDDHHHYRAAQHTHHEGSPQAIEEHVQLLATDRAASHHRSTSSSSSSTPVDRQAKAAVSERPVQFDFDEGRSLKPALWLPYTLRRVFLSSLAVVSLVLSVTLLVLTTYSSRNHGLRDDDGSVGLFFARRYVPTIIAVFFTLAITMVAEDVKGTEAFARMANPKPVAADYTLFYVPKVWWKSVHDGLSPKRNGGHRRWVLSLSSLAAGISILSVSAFSSSIFTTQQILIQTEAQLQLYEVQQDGSIDLLPRRYTYSRTLSGFLYNTSTSPWVSDSYIVLPFALPAEGTNPTPLSDGLWEAETKVLKLESECMPMDLAEKTALNITYTSTGLDKCDDGACVKKSKGFKLRSQDGCEIQIQSPIAITAESPTGGASIVDPVGGYFTDALSLRGSIMWTNISSSYVSWQKMIQEYGESPRIDPSEDILDQWRRTFIYSVSDQCLGRELLLVSPPWYAPQIIGKPDSYQESYWENFTARAEICTPRYYEADIPVTTAIGGAFPRASFDESEFLRQRKPISEHLLDLDRLNGFAFGEEWKKYMTTTNGISDQPVFEGVSKLLAKPFSLNLTDMMQNQTLPSQASRLRARFFGELIWSSVVEADVPSFDDISGNFTKITTRIVVVPGIGISIAILLLLAACYSLAMLWYASVRKRPLNLHSDPSTTAGTASLIMLTSGLAAGLRSWQGHGRSDIQEKLGSRFYSLRAGTLNEQERADAIEESAVASKRKDQSYLKGSILKGSSKYDWRPLMLCKRWLATLLASLIAITITLLVLRKYADKGMLFQTAFIEQVKINQLHVNFSPHALIATLIAVLIALCWDGIDKSLRILQPYLAMSRKEYPASQSISVSYSSSYWAWAAIRSVKSGHWILCLVATGTTLTQILTVSMAAMFEKQTIIQTRPLESIDSIDAYRSRAIRQEPFEFGIGIGQRPFYLTNILLETDQTDWLYNALDEITLNRSTPAWTKDEWAFTPVDIVFRDGHDGDGLISGKSQNGSRNEAEYIKSSVNVSITTPAIRSRLECNPVRLPTTDWLDSVQDAFPDALNKSVTGHVLPTFISNGDSFSAPVFSAPRRMACCTNGTSPGGQSIVAYWSSNNTIYDKRPEMVAEEDNVEGFKELNNWSRRFAIKWVTGPTASTTVRGTDPTHIDTNVGYTNENVLYFLEEPQITVLDCKPIIEQVNASITLARYTKQILEFELLGPPQQVQEAWDYAYDVVYPDKYVPSSCVGNSSDFTCTSTEGTGCEGNVSYGAFFLSQLLTAPHILEPLKSSSQLVRNGTLEDVFSSRFSIRDTALGLNMDFVSYASYILAGAHPTALLDGAALQIHSEKTLQTFFKHFVTSGRWTYGSKEKTAAYEDTLRYADRAEGEVSQRIEVLTMNAVATWLSLGIVLLLMGILCILIVALQVVYPRKAMQRKVECLGDVLGMVAGSDGLVGLVREGEIVGEGPKIRLGWFRDRRGTVRWGVEAVGEVEWVDGPEEEVVDEEDRAGEQREADNTSVGR